MDNVWLNYKEALDGVEREIDKGLDSEVRLINEVTRYTLMSGGKRLRPLLLVISAQMCNVVDQQYLLLGCVVEYIHTATLLHDDVLDHAKNRRGRLAARNLYGNQASILAGDFLYTRAVRYIVTLESVEMNYLLSLTCNRMTEGEAWQLAHTMDFDLTEERYLKIIEYKTASLLSAACKLGSIVSKGSSEETETLSRFGRYLGIAFQIKDDTLDYLADYKRLGKPLGQDIKEGKITLPLIHLIAHCTEQEKEEMVHLIASSKSKKDTSSIIALMEKYGSIAYAKKVALDFVTKAQKELDFFKDSTHREALRAVANYAISRDY
jgi:octaprenyl-diphosphate synthase